MKEQHQKEVRDRAVELRGELEEDDALRVATAAAKPPAPAAGMPPAVPLPAAVAEDGAASILVDD